MSSSIDDVLARLGRPALVADEIKNPVTDILCRQGPPLGGLSEAWPQKDGKDLLPLLSLCVRELPFAPAFLQGFDYWTFFIEPETWEQIDRDGSLVVRRYKSVIGLRQLVAPPSIKPKPLHLRFRKVVDYPDQDALHETWAEQPALLRWLDSRAGELRERFPCHYGIKIGGYPQLIQPTAFLKTLDPDFQIQIDCSEYYHYGDSGIGYVCSGLSYACWETL